MRSIYFLIFYIFLYIFKLEIFGVNILTLICPFLIFTLSFRNQAFFKVFRHKPVVWFFLFYLYYSLIVIVDNNLLDSVVVFSNYLYCLMAVLIIDSLSQKELNIINTSCLIFVLLFAVLFFIEFAETKNTLIINVFNFKHRTSLAYHILYTYILFAITSNNKKILISMTALVTITLFVNSSRAPLIMLLLFATTILSVNIKKRYIFSLVIFFSFISTILFDGYFENTYDRFINIFSLDQSGGSNLYRYEAITSIVRYLKVYPWGNGLHSFQEYFDQFTFLNLKTAINLPADNSFALVAYNTGIMGLFLFSRTLYSLFLKLNVKSPPFIIAVVFILNCFTDEVFNGSIFLSILVLFLSKKRYS